MTWQLKGCVSNAGNLRMSRTLGGCMKKKRILRIGQALRRCSTNDGWTKPKGYADHIQSLSLEEFEELICRRSDRASNYKE
mmetsp:Transcript_28920/g.51161  ORF Transcript_28920/g.51161 Transcript_28920/m.51161 type:complete len:81 (+) Transcript_28920:2143-2385(+)